MKADLTRSTFRPEHGYTSVRMQQGRVQLDADWNEQADIQNHLDRTVHTDIIGRCGVPNKGGGFALAATPDGRDLTVSAGRLYADGILCQADATPVPVTQIAAGAATLATVVADGQPLTPHQWIELRATGLAPVLARINGIDVAARQVGFTPPLSADQLAAFQAAPQADLRRLTSYTRQPYLPRPSEATGGDPAEAPALLPSTNGTYLAYLDVWERQRTALEDGALREVALGGPDTTTRAQAVWQVKLLPLGPADLAVDCDHLPDWAAMVGASTGRLAARAQPETTPADLCTIPPGAGYRRLENQLYRVEVHAAGALGVAQFKWSRENGSVVVPWLGRAADRIAVGGLGPDAVLGFAAGDWVELTDDGRELGGEPGTLVKVRRPEGQDLVVDLTTATGTVDFADFPLNPKVRRWDDPAGLRVVDAPAAGGGWIDLEAGVQVRFGPGSFQVGDHWAIPARTADGDVLWPRDSLQRPLAEPPEGTTHHYCALGLVRVAAGTVTGVEDCRASFPTLTEICADDVCFDNDVCDMPGVETVQEALDRLCAQKDLRHHNKHLHGWGIVCGLQVECGPHDEGKPRRTVSIKPGYALDCDGNDIILGRDGKAVTVDVLQMIEEIEKKDPENPLLKNGTGEVSLILDPAEASGFRLERYDNSADKSRLPAGSLLADVYDECIKPIEEFLRKEFGRKDDETTPAAVRGRVAALVNVVAQPVNPTNGQAIYLSAREDEILRDFYNGLKALLRSETFCALFDNAKPFPAYFDGAPDMDTIFGSGHHSRIRVRPGGKEAYTVGAGLNPIKPSTAIHRYDLKARALIDRIDPWAGVSLGRSKADTGTAAVQDVAFSPDGNQIYAIVPAKDGENTLFRAGEIIATGISWRPGVTICGTHLVTLATTPADRANVYAIGLGQGLYRINPNDVNPNAGPLSAFAAVGHLEITPGGMAFATSSSQAAPPGAYDRVLAIPVQSPDQANTMLLPQSGEDAIAVVTDRESSERGTLFVTVGATGTADKRVVSFSLPGFDATGSFAVDDSTIRLQPFVTDDGEPLLLISSEDGYNVRMAQDGRLLKDWVLPAQVGPISMAADPKQRELLVLNGVSDTVTFVPSALIKPEYRFPFAALADYRKGVVKAFTDLTGGFLQFLKDCFCHHFLVNCPKCTGKEKLYLACISIRKRQVRQVCNFSKRRYVKSFPTVGYWMSVVPLAPLLRDVVEQACCLILPDYFSRYRVRAFKGVPSKTAAPRLKGASVRSAASSAQSADIRTRAREGIARLRMARRLVSSRLRAGPMARPKATPKLRAGHLEGQAVDQAMDIISSVMMAARRQPLAVSAEPLIDVLAGLFRPSAAGRQVTLFEEEGKVHAYSVGPAGGSGELRSMQHDLAEAQEALASREQELASLRTTVDRLEERQRNIETRLDQSQKQTSTTRKATKRTPPPAK